MHKQIIALLMCLLLVALPTSAYARSFAYGDSDSIGNAEWVVDAAGDIIPVDDSSRDIGETGSELQNVYTDAITLGGVEKSGWGSVNTPMSDASGYVYPTDGAGDFKIHDDGDVTRGGGTATDVVTVFDGNADDWYFGLDDSSDDLIVAGYGSTVGTDNRITVTDDTNATIVTLGDAEEYDTTLVLDGNENDFYIALDDTDNDLLIGVGATVDTDERITIADTSTATLISIGDDAAGEDIEINILGEDDDYWIAYDDTTQDLTFGVGTAVATDNRLAIVDDTDNSQIIVGDGAEFDQQIIFDGSAIDHTIGIDDTTDALSFSRGSVLGTAECFYIDNSANPKINVVAGIDVVGAADLDIGSADVTDVTVTTDGGTTIIDGVLTSTVDDTVDGVTDLLNLVHSSSDDGSTDADGVGIVFQAEDSGQSVAEVGSIDVTIDDVTAGTEDADFILRLASDGTISECLRIDNNSSTTAGGTLEYNSFTTETNGVIDVLELSLKNTIQTANDGFGMGVSFILDDETDVAEQQASMDVVMTDVTTTAEDADIVFSQNIAGAIEERVRFDADDDTILLTGTTPKMTIGDGGDEDAILTFDGQTNDFYMGFDTTDDLLNIGVGSAPGTTSAIEIDAGAIAIIPALNLSGDLSISTNMTTAAAGATATSYMVVCINNERYTIQMERL